ncbi:MAG TPA: hypothetical protein DDZ60_11780 [Planktothrix sp. UBA10369]|jgi:Uncharacterized conserved protein|nr:hypothetical protein [Planktothrix sp. UBA8402]HBK23152.1 hypothetical protein [Planktothrix sp. UBA10369]
MSKKLFNRKEFLIIIGGLATLMGMVAIAIIPKILTKFQGNTSGTSNSVPPSVPKEFIPKPESIKTATDKEPVSIVYDIYPENLNGTPLLQLLKIRRGNFTMGSPPEENGHQESEQPQFVVTFAKPFYMSRHPITQEQWEAVMGNNPSTFEGERDLPVETVSWNDANKFCEVLSQKTGRKYRLPSESEWEYACRAGTQTPFYFVDDLDANYDTNYKYKPNQIDRVYKGQTTPVGKLPANQFGLQDMHGNVWEWCSDSWHSNYIDAPRDGMSWTTGETEKAVIRGGAWHSFPSKCRSAAREWMWKKVKSNRIGFRVVCEDNS